ncbi:MAG: FoF1 ATP synthase subunit delta [Nitrospinota bacterium]
MGTVRKKITARVTSAIPLTSDIIARLEKSLTQSTGDEVEIKSEVDESIVGGLIIRIGDKIVDASLQKQLRMIRKEMLKG